ncbi:GlxA family transcriptional regulator [Nitrospirillum viridazoti]|uniref:AraC family transcriptional regulator n=1 Tax=Nitrospirillum viridazoti CBAmc TaxID=1441467 RepID=A0A248K1F4_9PROT|nr:GlxA family transcriptional regulator [Nitrospirillum amazonense]ASG24264.1 AraC family transcriptional regulator [Nitrospirillum amazonense CBAmc]TWB40729.1 transcriptional regulator GlxA family with amidase domain [Nitrospirillum amazonense]
MTRAPAGIGILGYDDVNALDVTGPAEVFANAADLAEWGEAEMAPGKRPYRVVPLGVKAGPFTSESGLTFTPAHSLAADDVPDLDTLIIAGGKGLREPVTNAAVAQWLVGNAHRFRRVASVCTGIYGLAASGLMDGRRVTTHWRHAADLARRFPRLSVCADALFLKDGDFYTAAGVTAGIDLALSLVEEDHGPALALATARELVVFMKRPGGQAQFSEPLRFQSRAADRFADLSAWMLGNLDRDLSVEELATRVNLSPRQFRRRFTAALGRPPADYVADLRLGEACRRLVQPGVSVDTLAAAIGFRSADAFRRAFRQRYGVSPSQYQAHFSPAGSS